MHPKRYFARLIILIIPIIPIHDAFAATRHVPVDYPTIQSCINAAISGQDECVVAPGTYNELINFLGKAITVRSSHGPPVTTISGTGLNGSVVTCTSGETPQTGLDGFTITGGVGTEFNGSTVGGGMYNYAHSSPSVRNCIFTDNHSDFGGGMLNGSDSNPMVTDCRFNTNTAIVHGGGIHNESCSPFIVNCRFNGNEARNLLGGGMSNYDASPTVAFCTFEGNSAEDGGGMANYYYSSPTVTNCVFTRNTSTGRGGGMSNARFGNPIVTDCDFSNNSADSGGGMDNYHYSNAIVKYCKFTGNTTTRSQGGGMSNFYYASPTVTSCSFRNNSTPFLGGGIGNSNESTPKIAECTFFGNTAHFGGGGLSNWINSPPTMVSNCTFVGNSSPTGGATYNYASMHVMNNCTFTENKAGDPGASVYNGLNAKLSMTNCVLWDADNLIDDEGSFKSSISFSGVQGGLPAGAVDGGGNIHLDPAFVRNPSDGGDGWGDNPDTPNDDESLNDDYGDLRLQPGSPCINAGDPDFAPPPGETDLDGHTRVLCERVDMGAYEFGIGDYDCDQAVTLADVAGMQNCFTGETDDSYLPACEPFDFDADSDIDLLDIARFQQIIAP